MKALIINLKERTDRWETFQEAWKHTNLELHRVDAIRMDDVYHAVFLKHRELLKQAEDETILIMEDDARPCKDFDIRFQQIQDYLLTIPDWDVMNGGMLAIRDKVEQIHRLGLNSYLLRPTRGCMAHFLLMKVKPVLEKIQTWEDEGKPEFDAWYPKRLRCLAAVPFLATQADGHSDASKGERTWSDRFAVEEETMLYSIFRMIGHR